MDVQHTLEQVNQALEQLREENRQLRLENAELRQRLEEATVRIKELEARLNQDSHNSNWPPSRDKSRPKRKIKSLRRQTGKQAGGQEGHQGRTIAYHERPDVIEVHRPKVCSQCAEPLGDEIEAVTVSKRQVLELPPLRYITVEHQAEGVCCPECGQMNMGEFPEGVTNPVQYGESVKQAGVYLHIAQMLPYERARETLAELFELPLSTGSLANFVTVAAIAVEPATTAIKEALQEAEVLHADETGCYINGQRYWLHTASTPELSYFEPHISRGKQATDEIGILPHFGGQLVHDNFPFYFLYNQSDHALCNAHHLRELLAVAEDDNQLWAKLMIELLCETKEWVKRAFEVGETSLPTEVLTRIEYLFEVIVAIGLEENPLPNAPPPPHKRGRPKKSKARNLVERFALRKTEILRFAHDFKVPFDNNLAERDIRMMKLQQKISGCFRSWTGAKEFARLRSYLSTIRKQGLSVWDALGSLFGGVLLMPDLTPE